MSVIFFSPHVLFNLTPRVSCGLAQQFLVLQLERKGSSQHLPKYRDEETQFAEISLSSPSQLSYMSLSSSLLMLPSLGEDGGSGFLSAFMESIRTIPAEMQEHLDCIRALDSEVEQLSTECNAIEKQLSLVRSCARNPLFPNYPLWVCFIDQMKYH